MSVRFGLWYDFRNPPQFNQSLPKLYEDILAQIGRAEALGWDDVWISEHHFAPDDYTPSPLVLAGAIAARTRQMQIGTSVLLLLLHDPVRVAEDSATVDVLSNGRFNLGVGLGYAPHEVRGFGLDGGSKRERYEEALELLQRLLAGEQFTFNGKYYRRNDIILKPAPAQQPMPVWVGAMASSAIDRAARIGANFIGAGTNLDQVRQYREALVKYGRDPARYEVAGGFGGFEWLHVASDPEKRWREAERHFLWQYELYVQWSREAGGQVEAPRNGDALRNQGVRIVTPSEAVERIGNYLEASGVTRYYAWTLPPGLPAEWADEHIELMARDVIPQLRNLPVHA